MVDSRPCSGREGGLLGIGLFEVLWKAIASLLIRRLAAAISFHDILHGFRSGQGTETSALEANLLQQLTSMMEAVLFGVFLDLRKAYDALEWGISLDHIKISVLYS